MEIRLMDYIHQKYKTLHVTINKKKIPLISEEMSLFFDFWVAGKDLNKYFLTMADIFDFRTSLTYIHAEKSNILTVLN